MAPTDDATPALETPDDALAVIATAWPSIVGECRLVLGGELHYQAMIYHCLRNTGVPIGQIGMNVKQWITDPVSPLFQTLDLNKHELYRGGFEPIPDVVLFSPAVQGDWRRRNQIATLKTMLAAIEVKASERAKARLRAAEILRDIEKLAAHSIEVTARAGRMHPVMMVIDTAPIALERMTEEAVRLCRDRAQALGVQWFYLSPDTEQNPGQSGLL